mgnify:CR=1 FL=1|jgi:hypothetical protein
MATSKLTKANLSFLMKRNNWKILSDVNAIYTLERGLCSESARNMTQPDGRPIATVAADIRNEEGSNGRYSGGNHNTFDPLKVIQEKSSLKPNPCIAGRVKRLTPGATGSVDPKYKVPIIV